LGSADTLYGEPIKEHKERTSNNKYRTNASRSTARNQIMAGVVKSVLPGKCNYLDQNNFYGCALTSTDCSAGFQSSRDTFHDAHSGSCHARDALLLTYTGKCTDEDICTGHPSACLNPDKFVRTIKECTVVPVLGRNEVVVTPGATFGRCDDTCYWSSDDCIAPEQWSIASSNIDCSCDKVQVGACKDSGGNYYCAVEEASCTEGTFIAARDLRDDVDAPDCRLCPIPVKFTTTSVSMESSSASSMDVEAPSEDTEAAPLAATKPNSNTGTIAGAAVGGTLAAVIVCAFVFFVGRKFMAKNIEKQRFSKNHNAPPIKDFSMDFQEGTIEEVEDLEM